MEHNTEFKGSREDVCRLVTEKLKIAIETVFTDVHQTVKTRYGDITPQQEIRLDYLIEMLGSQLANLITDQVWQNLDSVTMSVVLKEDFKSDTFILALNRKLKEKYGSSSSTIFATKEELEEIADAFNNNQKNGEVSILSTMREITKDSNNGAILKPLTTDEIQQKCYWLRIGEYHFDLSEPANSNFARNAIAVCKWLTSTNYRYVDLALSQNYNIEIVRKHLDNFFEREDYDLKEIWGHKQ